MVKFGNLTPAFKQGAQAYADGVKVKQNPFKYGSQEWEDWRDGFQMCKAVALCCYLIKDGEKAPEKQSGNGVSTSINTEQRK